MSAIDTVPAQGRPHLVAEAGVARRSPDSHAPNFPPRSHSPLSDEDQVVQTQDDVSPTKWHLAHTTWFFETFVLMVGSPKL